MTSLRIRMAYVHMALWGSYLAGCAGAVPMQPLESELPSTTEAVALAPAPGDDARSDNTAGVAAEPPADPTPSAPAEPVPTPSASQNTGGHEASSARKSPQPHHSPAQPECPSAYTAAVHVVINVAWERSTEFAKGAGELHLWTKSAFAEHGDAATVTSRPCGCALPPVQTSSLAGGYDVSLEIPGATWEVPSMPTFAGAATHKAGLWNVNPGAALLGLSMDDPLGAWPKPKALRSIDHDADGQLGITLIPRTDGTFKAPPVTLSQKSRADKLFLASRSVMAWTATMQGCPKTVAGTVEVSQLDFRMIGCHVTDGEDCTKSESEFLDDHRMEYELTSARFTAARISDAATCAEVRAALP